MAVLLLAGLLAGNPLADDTWVGLDRELEALARAGTEEESPLRVGGFLRIAVLYGDFDLDDDLMLEANEEDIVFFTLLDVRPMVEWRPNAEFSALIDMQGADGTFRLERAFADWSPLGADTTLRMGLQRQPLFFDWLLTENRLFFLERSEVSERTGHTENGAALIGAVGPLQWWLAAQNGSDGLYMGVLATGRVSWTVLGEQRPECEGAIAATPRPSVTLAAAFEDDGSIAEGYGWTAEFDYQQTPYSVSAEVAALGEGLGDSTPWSAMATYVIEPDRWELGVRYEDYDDLSGLRRFSVGINNYYGGEGVRAHDLKWTLDGGAIDGDTGSDEGAFLAFGLTITF